MASASSKKRPPSTALAVPEEKAEDVKEDVKERLGFAFRVIFYDFLFSSIVFFWGS